MPGSMLNAWPGCERQVVAGDDVRVLVRLDADAVAGAVDEPVAEPGVGDHVARGGVDVLARRADGRRPHRPLLRVDEHRVGVAHLGVGLAHDEHARDVGAVAAHRAAEVAQHDVAGADHAVAGLVVRARAVRARWRRWRSSPARGRRRASARRARGARRPRCVPRTAGRASRRRSRRRHAAAARSAAISAASFTMRSGPVTSLAFRNRALGSAAWRSSTNRAHVWSPIAARRRPSPTEPDDDRATGSSVSSHGDDLEHVGLRLDPRAPRAAGPRASRRPSRRHDEHREPLERHRLVAGEVRQVGADRQQQHVDAELRPSAPAPAPSARRTSRLSVGAHDGRSGGRRRELGARRRDGASTAPPRTRGSSSARAAPPRRGRSRGSRAYVAERANSSGVHHRTTGRCCADGRRYWPSVRMSTPTSRRSAIAPSHLVVGLAHAEDDPRLGREPGVLRPREHRERPGVRRPTAAPPAAAGRPSRGCGSARRAGRRRSSPARRRRPCSRGSAPRPRVAGVRGADRVGSSPRRPPRRRRRGRRAPRS